MNDVIFRTK